MSSHRLQVSLLGRGRLHGSLSACAAILVLFLLPTSVSAQPIGYQEYYVLGYEEHMWRAFRGIYDGPDGNVPGRICSTVSLVTTTDRQVIYYDHWEDGYEADLLHPVQATTEIYGDGDPGNGGTGSDVLAAGDNINLTSTENTTGPNAIHGYVKVDPARNPDDLRYDGGDHIVISGGPANLTHAMWPIFRSWVGGAWEVYSREVYGETYSYRIPIGEDLYDFGGGDNGIYGDFRNVYLQLQAFEDNTTVAIDNGTDTVNLTLDRGQTYSSIGYINSTSASSITINTGTTIRSNKPVQVGLVTGADSVEGYQGRSMLVLPDELWGADYIVPVPSGYSGEEAEVYLSNPNDFSIAVHGYDRETQVTFVISPTSYISATVPYSEKRGGYVPADSGARFTSSDGTFGVVVCADTSGIDYSWGFAAIPSQYLTEDYYVPWAPGSYNTPPTENGSPVWVTPLGDDTTFYVDFSPLDGSTDETFTLDVLEQRRIFDPDNDNTGMHVWATGQFAIVWGEDPRTAEYSSPYLDLGVTTLPLMQRWLDPMLTLEKTAEPTILPPAGGTATFTLLAQAGGASLVDVNLADTLPAKWTYIPGSTSVTYPGGGIGTPEPWIDGQTLSWDLEADLGAHQSLRLTFEAQITDTGGVTASVNRGAATGELEYADVFLSSSDKATVYISPLALTKAVNSAEARIGDTLIYTLSYANPDDFIAVTNAVLRDAVPIQHVEVESVSEGGHYDPASGSITWSLGTIAPGASGSVGFTATVNDFEEDGTIIENVGFIDSDQTEVAGSNSVRTRVRAPRIALTKEGPTVATPGQVITYTLSYENLGGANATGVAIQDTIPIPTTYVGGSLAMNTGTGWVDLTDAVDGDQGAFVPPKLLIHPGIIPGTIAPSESGQIRFNVRLDENLAGGALIRNWATLDRDLDTPQDSNMVVTRISDLLISKSAAQSTVDPGGVISYTLVYENASATIPQTEVIVREPIPVHTSLIAGTVYGGDQIEYSWDNGVHWSSTPPGVPVTHIRWHDAEVPPSAQLTLGFAVQVTTTVPPATTIQNMAHITSTQIAAAFGQWVPSNQVNVPTTATCLATIDGTVFHDSDGDGVQDPGEWGIPDVLITLDESITTTTDLNGAYGFSITEPGVHTVVETDPSSFSRTAERREGLEPGGGSTAPERAPAMQGILDEPTYTSTTPNEVHVDVRLGRCYEVNFGDMPTDPLFASIYGTVFVDADGDGAQDPDELGIPDVHLTLDGSAATTTDLYGTFTFATTEAGPHAVVETDPDGTFSTTPNEVHLDVAALGVGYQVEFGDAPVTSGFATIYGTVFQDLDTDRFRDLDELGIAGVLVTLDGVHTTTTGAYGSYALSTQEPGPHTVLETDLPNHDSTTPNQVHVDVTPGHGYRVDFGDKPPGGICYPDIYEEDDTADLAVTFVVGTKQAHQFCNDDTDWVRFSARAGAVYTITTSASGQRADTLLALFDTDGQTLLATSDDYQDASDFSSRIVWPAPAAGTYYVRTNNRGGLTGDQTDYYLLIDDGGARFFIYLPIAARNHGGGTKAHQALYPVGIIHHTCPDVYEPDDTWWQASKAIEPGVVQVHSFDSDPALYVADKDFIPFEASNGRAVIFIAEPVTNTRPAMAVYDDDGTPLNVTGADRLVWEPPTSSRYYLSVSPQAGVTSFGCSDAVGYNLRMESVEMKTTYLPVVTRTS